ncbi:hypothetical protein JB92DRAFT_2892611 [Gautieria morchelliformis]|nr:hypothetical protein JB92DRAFT_2892611 [Gautieria morchelliformis]
MENQLPFLHSLGLLHRELMTLEDDRRLFMQPIHLRPLGVGAPGFLAPPAPLLHPPLEPQPYPKLPPHPLPAFQPLARPLPIPAFSSPADNPLSPAPLASRGDRDRRRKAKAIARLKSEEATSHLPRGGSRPRKNKQRHISVDTQPGLGARSRSAPPSFARDGRWPRGEETEEKWARSVGQDCSFWSSTPSRSCQTTPWFPQGRFQSSGNVFIRGHP